MPSTLLYIHLCLPVWQVLWNSFYGWCYVIQLHVDLPSWELLFPFCQYWSSSVFHDGVHVWWSCKPLYCLMCLPIVLSALFTLVPCFLLNVVWVVHPFSDYLIHVSPSSLLYCLLTCFVSLSHIGLVCYTKIFPKYQLWNVLPFLTLKSGQYLGCHD